MRRNVLYILIPLLVVFVWIIIAANMTDAELDKEEENQLQLSDHTEHSSPKDNIIKTEQSTDSVIIDNDDNNDQEESTMHSSHTNSSIEIPLSPQTLQEQIICHTGFTISFNKTTLNPNWVAWELTSKETEGTWSRKGFEFVEDYNVKADYRVSPADYSGSGYDRGHMCPAADMKWSKNSMYDCHYMTNICPQERNLNQNYWERLERSCRRWAQQEGNIFIVCGPVFFSNRKNKTIGNEHFIAVPNAFFKVVLSLRKGNEKAIGFYYTNRSNRQTMEMAARSVDEIEKITGIDFFYSLPDEQENKLESTFNLNKWN